MRCVPRGNVMSDLQKKVQQLNQMFSNSCQGNLVWRSLNQNNAGGWFKFGGNEFLQAAMSVTGSVVVKPPESAPDGKGESNPRHVAKPAAHHRPPQRLGCE